eukprot:101910-Pleurochrysis_carterae.AAC.1
MPRLPPPLRRSLAAARMSGWPPARPLKAALQKTARMLRSQRQQTLRVRRSQQLTAFGVQARLLSVAGPRRR